jgi:HSP20 family molecular chaperone IbpA
VRLIEKQDVFVVRASLIGIDPESIDVLATAQDVLIQSREATCRPRVFKAVHFPSPVVPIQIHGTYVKQTLILIAPKLSQSSRPRTTDRTRGVLNICL